MANYGSFGWQEHEDAIAQHMSPAYFDAHTFGALPSEFQFPHDFDSRVRTKAGGVPYWTTNGPAKVPPRPFDYLMQIDTFLSIQASPSRPLHPGTLAGPVRDWLRCLRAQGEWPDGYRPVPTVAKRENAPWSAMQELD